MSNKPFGITVIAATLALLSVVLLPGSPSSAATVHLKLRAAVAKLHVAKHSHAGSYDREAKFGDWIEQGGGCDTRAVVLKAESQTPTTQNKYCTIKRGRWYSYYDAETYRRASKLQIDHTVPLANAWVSGAWDWTQDTRIRYANDLGDARTLVAVDSHDNESKGDQDPTSWLPSHGQCRYVRSWTVVKYRWRLNVTQAEKDALSDLASGCKNATLTIKRATVVHK